MIEFCLGVVVGVAGIFAVAAHFSNKAAKATPEAPQQGIAATSVSMNSNNGGIASLDVWHQRLMKDVIERIEGKA
jgi:hypothetical protein